MGVSLALTNGFRFSTQAGHAANKQRTNRHLENGICPSGALAAFLSAAKFSGDGFADEGGDGQTASNGFDAVKHGKSASE